MKKYLITTLALCFILPSLAKADITTSLFGLWTFDEGSGTTANDYGPNNNTAALLGTNAPTWTTGKIGPFAISLVLGSAGNGGYASSTNTLASSLTGETFSSWIYPTNLASGESGHNYIISNQRSNAIMEVNSSANLSFIDRVGGVHTYTGSTIPLNTWTLVSVSCAYDNTHTLSTTTLYINGISVKQDTGTTPCDYNQTQIFYVGASGQSLGHFGFTGYIDDARVYNRPLSDADILELYNIGSDITSNLAARYTFDNANTTYSNGGSLNDSSGNGVNGSIFVVSPGTASSTTGIFNEAAHFTGINNAQNGGATFSSTSQLPIGTGDFSISVWAKASSNQFSNILSTYNSGTVNNGYALYWSSGTLLWGLEATPASQNITTSVTMDGSTWHHFVGTYSQTGVMTLYVDGIEKNATATNVPTGNITNQKTPLLGRTFASNPAQDITMDEMCIYNRELDSNEVLSLYNKGSGNTCSTPIPSASTFTAFQVFSGSVPNIFKGSYFSIY